MIKLALGLVALSLTTSAALGEDMVVATPDALKWGPAPPSLPKGAQMAVLSGDPSGNGPYMIRSKLPAGYQVPAHNHPTVQNVTVISGTSNVGMGDKLDETKGEPVKAGGFFQMPKGMHHYVWFSEDTILQSNGIGPAGITYINPADDPRKTN